MFCHKCGTKIADGAEFCHKCGARAVIKESAQQVSVSPAQTAASQQAPITSHAPVIPPRTAKLLADTESSGNSVELLVHIVKVEGRAFSKLIFPVSVDDTQIGELSNGGTSAYKVTPGQHCVKIGSTSIWIDVPKGNNPVTLNLQWGVNRKPEIICPQSHLVTKPSEPEKITAQALFKSLSSVGAAGLVCIVLGAIGLIVGVLLFPSASGSYFTAEQHVAMSAAMDFALPFIIGGFAFVITGAIILILSSRKK